MTTDIRILDSSQPETVALVLPLFAAALAADAPAHPRPSESLLRFIIAPRKTRERTVVAAFDDDLLVGYGCLTREVFANRDLLYGDIWVDPARRETETADRLLTAFKDYGTRLGASRLLLGTPATAYQPLFIEHSGRIVNSEKRSQVDLTKIDLDQYAEWATPSSANGGYRSVLWQPPTPDDLIVSYTHALDTMRDAPLGDLVFETPPPDVDRHRAVEADFAKVGTHLHIGAALAPDGTVAGFTQVFVFRGDHMASVGNTGVVAAHRGHGLGLRLKAEMTLHLLRIEPAIDVIETWNNEDNEPMLRVNRTLGYEVADVWQNWQFDL